MQADEIALQLLDARVEMTGYFRSVILDAHLAEDVFQDVCVRAIRAADTFNDAKHLRRWCHTVGRNRAIDLLRSKDRKRLLFSEDVLAKLEADENLRQPSSGTQARLEALGQCLAELTPRSQRIVALRYGEELSGIDVAAKMECKVDTLYKALARIYQNLRSCIREKLQEPSP